MQGYFVRSLLQFYKLAVKLVKKLRHHLRNVKIGREFQNGNVYGKKSSGVQNPGRRHADAGAFGELEKLHELVHGTFFMHRPVFPRSLMPARQKTAELLPDFPHEQVFCELNPHPVLGIIPLKRDYPQHWMRIQFTKNLFMRKIREELSSLLARWHKASREDGPVHEKSPMHKFMELFQLAERAGIRMPPAGALYARTFLSIDVAILELAPDFNIPQVVTEFFDKFDGEFIKLEKTPDEIPPYLRPDLEGEEAEILKMLDEELKTLDRELLTERVSGMMESLE